MLKKGFTLVELVVVLAVLALVTHLAVREMGHLRDGRLRQAADTQLESLRDAVWRLRPGEEPTGFVVDLGRLPRGIEETNGLDRTTVCLSELWRCPEGVRPYALRAATPENLVGKTNELADATVRVGCGWRGPYVRLPLGADRLVDAWGNRMENRDEAGYDRLLADDGSAVAADAAVWQVRHLGADGRLDAETGPGDVARRDATVRLLPASGAANALSVVASFVAGTGPVGVNGDVRFRWYAPCGGMITGDVATVEMEGAAVATCTFESVPPGVATLVVDIDEVKCAQERVVVPPGGRELAIKVYVP